MIQNVTSKYPGVSVANSPAGPATKTAPTKTIKRTVNPRINCLKLFPRYRPINSGKLSPSCLSESIPAKASCVAPANILPNTIHKKEAVPNLAPMIAPKIGPKPAIFKNWIMKIFQVGNGI